MDNLKRIRSASKSDDCADDSNRSPKKIKSEDDEIQDMFADSTDDWCFEDFNDKENVSTNQESPTKIIEVNKLDLKSWKRCCVAEVTRDAKNFDLILDLIEKNANGRGICRLQGPWCHTKIQQDQIVSVKGVWSDKHDCYVVNQQNGMIVTDPDFLISGTTVVGSLFCKRKCILQQKFQGIDADNKIMIVGKIVHELLQTVLQNKIKTYSLIEKTAKDLLSSPNMIFTLYSSKMTAKEAEDELFVFIPRIVEFIERYITGTQKNTNKDVFDGCITDIEDIEQNLWVPQLGLKGKIDVSVRIKPSRKAISIGKLVPLELKTGKSSFSNEHKGQVTLYNMMLQEIGENVDSGLLLYVRDSIMKEIRSTRNEKRDLIMLRNDLSHYLCNGNKLPEPINHYNACGKCPYNLICTSLMRRSSEEKLSQNHPLNKLTNEISAHLAVSHFDYFIHWCSILSLEEHEEKRSNQTKDMWTESVEKRVKNGCAIDNLVVSKVVLEDSRFIHTFKHENGVEISPAKIQIGEYVLISTGDRINVAAGHVQGLTENSITISLERDLSMKFKSQKFVVDKHFSTSSHVFNFTNLGVLLDDTEGSKRLRDFVIDKQIPTFAKVVPRVISDKGSDILIELNPVQRAAVLKALSANDYMLIKGLPGTGKTQTIVAIIRLLHMMNKSIIITSHTNSAVDNVLIRLKEYGVKFLRLGSDLRINPLLHDSSENQVTKSCKTVEDLAETYSSYNIVGVTCLGSAHALFLHKKYDVCIVDEASQVFQPTILRPIMFASKFILVGDPDQLPPVIRSKQAKELGADESLFQRLDCEGATSVLTVQYRMNRGITKLANDLIYQGSLECANDDIKFSSLKYLKSEKLKEYYKDQKWVVRTLEKHVDFSTMFLDTQDCLERTNEISESKCKAITQVIEKNFSEEEIQEKKNSKFECINYCEAAIAFTLVKALLIAGCSATDIGIIAPYRAQVELLKKLLEQILETNSKQNGSENFYGLEVNTVDQFQGRDKDIIIYSCTRTGTYATSGKSKSHILEDRRRITVAITRSKHKLIVIGDQKCLIQFTPFRDLYEKIPGRCKLTLKNCDQGFSWDSVLSIIQV